MGSLTGGEEIPKQMVRPRRLDHWPAQCARGPGVVFLSRGIIENSEEDDGSFGDTCIPVSHTSAHDLLCTEILSNKALPAALESAAAENDDSQYGFARAANRYLEDDIFQARPSRGFSREL